MGESAETAVRASLLEWRDSGAECDWYGLCHTVLTWFLSSTGMGPAPAKDAVFAAIGGRFKSWTAPSWTLVEAAVDGLGVWCGEGNSSSSPTRGDLLLAALTPMREDASRRRPLSWVLLAAGQRVVLALPAVLFRQGGTFVKAAGSATH